jgi:hypothetical protein
VFPKFTTLHHNLVPEAEESSLSSALEKKDVSWACGTPNFDILFLVYLRTL